MVPSARWKHEAALRSSLIPSTWDVHCQDMLAFDREGRWGVCVLAQHWTWHLSAVAPRVGLGGEGMLHHKKWPLELALFRQNPRSMGKAVTERLQSVFLLAPRALITVCVQTATVSWLMQYPVCGESRRFGHDQTEQFLGRASAAPACSSSVAFKPKSLVQIIKSH